MSSGHFIKNYWSFYLQIEKDVINTKKYVDFTLDNYETYSLEFLKLFNVICSEIEVIGKLIAQTSNDSFNADMKSSIKRWGIEVQLCFPELNSRCVILRDSRFELVPFKNWSYEYNNTSICLKEGAKSLFWWKDYCSIKHARLVLYKNETNNYRRANLKNVLYSLSALYLLERLFLEKNYNITHFNTIEESKLFLLPKDIHC